MGGYVAAAFATMFPDRTGGLVLVDGGPAIGEPPPEDADVEAVLHSVIRPALARPRRTFPSRGGVRALWRGPPPPRRGAADPSLRQLRAMRSRGWMALIPCTKGNAAIAEFACGTFSAAGEFATKVAALCDAHNHHAEIDIRFPDVVRVTTSSTRVPLSLASGFGPKAVLTTGCP